MPSIGVQTPAGRVAHLDRVSASETDAHPGETRYWSKVDKTDGCWNWTGAVTSAGYGSFAVITTPKPKMVSAHKVAWEWANGPVPEGLVLMHSCDNRRCVRLDHLSVGSVNDNNRDMANKGRAARKLTDVEVLTIRARRALGDSCVDIGRDFAVSPVTIGRIAHRRTWRHLP